MKISNVLLTVLFGAFAGVGGADGVVRVSPEGHLREFLQRQVSGLTGNRGAMGYPFDGCMWAGAIPNVYFEEDLPYSRKVAAPRDEIWWPYEQTAYFLDGMMRLSRLVDAPELRSEFKRNLDWCIEHQASDGDLFAAYSKSTCQWPMVVFFRAALAYLEETGDERAKAAFVRHYAAKRNAPQGTDDRDVLNVEGMLKVAEWTGDRSYVSAAEDWFRKHHYCERFANTDRVHSHGVTFCEMMKLPMLLGEATGKSEWRKLGIKAMRDVFRHNETPNGQVSACEYLSGRDPWEGSETCDAADMMCALSHFLGDPEAGCEAADHMERIAYNALPGATTKDFTAHQYISLPNQVVATPFSHGGHFFYGEPDWNRFRVCHFAQCCSGNINRAMPLFVENMWREKAGGERQVTALLLGPGRVKGEGFEIGCETDYPFGDRLVYRFKLASADGRTLAPKPPRAFAFRVPSWVVSATVSKNGTPMNLAARPGTLAKIEDDWKDGDTLVVDFEQPVTFHSDRHWHWLRRGALTLAHPVKTRCVREKPDAKFSDLSFEEPGPFNYAFDLKEVEDARLAATFVKSTYPFETPNFVVKVPMREIREWQGLSEQRFTPPVPLYTHETGRTVTLDFVPYATTLTRITAFPDTVKRTALPVVRVYAAPECYDYNPKKPLAEQRGEPEDWTDDEFCDKGTDVQRSPDLWTDCEAQYLVNRGKFAYLLFRFWSDCEGPVTCALGASRCVQAFVDGKEVYANGPIVEGRMVAPFWFSLHAKKGYNFLKVKVATNGKEKVFGQDQYRREWGAKLDVFRVPDGSPSASKLPPAMVLAEHGRQSAYTIVLPDGPSPSQVTAAGELRAYIERMTGVALSIATNVSPACGIFLGNGAVELGDDGFRIRSDPPHLRIEGGRVHGTLFGVYDFLERYCGCEWLSPKTSVIPHKARIAVPTTLDDVQKPAFLLRDMNWTDQLADWTFTAKLKMNGFRTVYPEALGGQNHAKDTTTGGATFDSLCPPKRHFKEHPEWFAMVEGRRRGERVQRCLTNKGFLDFLVGQVKERIRRNYPHCKYYSIYPNDFRRNCECADCKALDVRGGSPSASLVHMANTVAEAVAKDYPDVSILTFAYMYTLKPPKGMTVHPNVMICYCTDACDFSKPIATSKWNGCKEFVENFRGWKALTDKIYIWDYSANFKYLFQPFECCHVLPENFRFFREHGAVGVFEEGDHYGHKCVDEALKTWMIAHLLWNPDQPLEPLLDRFFRGYYGAAADVGRGYYDALVDLEAKRDEAKEPLVMWGTVLNDGGQPRAFFDEWSRKWNAALELVKDDPVRRENVYWARHNVDLVRVVRAPCAAKHRLSADLSERERKERAELKPVAQRILADFARVKGLNKFKDDKFVRERVRTVAELDLANAAASGRCLVLAADLLFDKNLATTFVDDSRAANGKALRIAAEARDGMHHCIALREISFEKDPGTRIGIRIHARVERTGVTTGTAFSAGTCDMRTFKKRDIRYWQLPVAQVTGDGYAWYEVEGTWTPAGNETLWIGNGKCVNAVNPCVKAVYVDQVELFRK